MTSQSAIENLLSAVTDALLQEEGDLETILRHYDVPRGDVAADKGTEGRSEFLDTGEAAFEQGARDVPAGSGHSGFTAGTAFHAPICVIRRPQQVRLR